MHNILPAPTWPMLPLVTNDDSDTLHPLLVALYESGHDSGNAVMFSQPPKSEASISNLI